MGIAAGLMVEARDRRISGWLVTAPLVRYEMLALTGLALGVLFVRGHHLKSVLVGVLVAALLLAYSAFLIGIGLDYLPSSILAKARVLESTGTATLRNILEALSVRQGLALVSLALVLTAYALFGARTEKRLIAVCGAGALAAHIALGKTIGYHRYELYAVALGMLVALYLYGGPIRRRPEAGWLSAVGVAGLVSVAGLALGFPYLVVLGQIPTASNNIYSQQYQMHRVATAYVRDRVAVNDLGYVAFENEHYVLDLWGLSSREARLARRAAERASGGISGGAWMGDLVRERGIPLVMVYEAWFQVVPGGSCGLGQARRTAARRAGVDPGS
ncbi:MAG: hypothetical protein AAGA11_05115 [Pseudomonadota bacterium]